MKQYGFNEATEISKKQIGVIYAAAKRGDLQVERWYMTRLYDLADFYGMDENGSVAKEEQDVKAILDTVFAKNWEAAQQMITETTEQVYNLLSNKNQKKANRALVA